MMMMILVTQPCFLIKGVFYLLSFIFKLTLAKRVMRSKSIKPRKSNQRKRMTIQRVP